MRRPAFSFVVPVRDDRDRLLRCLASIRRSAAGEAVEVIVADNGSADGSDIAAERAGARVLRLPGQRVSELRNSAAAAARGDLIAFVDADHEIDAGWINAAREALTPATVGGVGAPYHSPAGGTWVQHVYGGLRRGAAASCDVDWLPSGNLVVKREVFERIGGFDATLQACEDVDLCARIRAAGWRLVLDPRVRSVHYGDPATLAALFRGELWRGRDNLRVSLRRGARLRDLPSVVIPIVDLLLLGSAGVGLASVSRAGSVVALTSLVLMAVLAGARALLIAGRLQTTASLAGLRAFAVALVYDTARALALVLRVSHNVRRRA